MADERARIAREMRRRVSQPHRDRDAVRGAANVLDSDPERARQSLASIEATARRGLEEMLRRMLGLLGESDAELKRRSRGSDRLDELLATVHAADIEVDSTFRGEQRPLPAAVDVSAYRLVQESLTSVMKHAGARQRAGVALEPAPEHLDIEVVDDGTADSPGAPPDAG